MEISRRTFMIAAVGTVSGLALSRAASAQAGQKLSESDPQARALGYRDDATKVDKAKFPKYAAGQDCARCQLYGGKPADATGTCAIFQNKSVAAKGWCSAWARKA